MLITFSKPELPIGLTLGQALQTAADVNRTTLDLKWVRGNAVRFTVRAITPQTVPSVIRYLLTLDPQAEVRTAKGHFNGLADFERQQRSA